jgi:predicted MPP superfamily phosphohydrolase
MKAFSYATITMIAWAASSSAFAQFPFRFVPPAQLAALNTNPQQTHFAILGDTQNAPGNWFMQRFGEVAQAVAQTNPDFVQTVGDNIVLGWPGIQRLQWRQWYRNAEPLLEVAPVLPGWGNHDTSTHAIYRHFALPGELFARFHRGAYSYDAGPVHVSVLNDSYRHSFLLSRLEIVGFVLPSFDMNSGSRQYRWLERDLASVPDDQWKIVIAHKPPYSVDGGYHDTKNLTQLADQYGVDLVVSGHTHTYESSYPVVDGTTVTDGEHTGTTYLVAGTSGAHPNTPSASRMQQTPWLRTAQTGETGYVTIDATPQTMNIQSYTVDGQLFDSINLSHPSAP